MDSVKILRLGAAMGLLLCSCAGQVPADPGDIATRARRIHHNVLTLDTHVDIPVDFASDSVDPGLRGRYRVDLPKMEQGGLDAVFWIVYVRQTRERDAAANAAHTAAMVKFDAIHRVTEELYPEQIELAYTADDVARIHAAGKKVAAIGIENGFVIGRDLTLIDRYHALGARYITLAHGGHNDICDSATPRAWDDSTAEHGGVSPFGAQVIAAMNRVGIMVDVSHISRQSMLDAVRLSQAPVIASHSSVRALADHPRNLDDEQMLALRDNGGVMQTVAFGLYVKVDPPEKGAALQALRTTFGLGPERKLEDLAPPERAEHDTRLATIHNAWPPPNVQDFVDHIDYAVHLIGIDHVGISSDFDGGGGIDGWYDASQTLNVTTELVRRGYTEPQIRKLWGGNLLRVWHETERVAALLQAQTMTETMTQTP
ncbi:MAG: dipeptidase [bacterium]|nr:dipeptidase [bacterium]